MPLLETVSPFIVISPRSIFSNPAIALNKVLFPHPLGPRIANISPVKSSILVSLSAIVSPKLLVAVGGSAAKAILNIDGGILRHRGTWKEIILKDGSKIPIIATLHPAYLLRAPNQKKLAWEDLKLIRSKLEEFHG